MPKGAGVRTTTLTRDRDALSAVLQYELPEPAPLLLTAEYLRADQRPRSTNLPFSRWSTTSDFYPVPLAGTTSSSTITVFSSPAR